MVLLTLFVLFVLVIIPAPTLRSKQGLPDLSDYPWLYLRDDEPLAAGESVVEVIVVGDVMLGRAVAGISDSFAATAPWLRAADLALANLECVIAPEGMACPTRSDVPDPTLQQWRLCAPPSAVAALHEAGFDVLGLANNHALDLGPAGLAETVSRLETAGLATVGAGLSRRTALRPLIRQVREMQLAFLAFNAVPSPADTGLTTAEALEQDGSWTRADWDRARVVDAVTAARSQADAVIVFVHWGYEYETRADPAQRDAARVMLEAGADLVIGHHPHVVQECEVFSELRAASAAGDQFVAYSLGNFVFDQERGETRQGLALRVFFDDQGLRAVQALPVWAGPRPRLMAPDEAASLVARVRPPPCRIGFTCDSQACYPVEVEPPQTAKAGLFWGGEIDLTGDGVLERVRRAGEQVVIYRGGVEVWRSPPEWQVVDLAVGDPNDDGRGELLLAFWKPDVAGVLRSHPFIIGYREGAYRILWGGSAVSDPIHEVELGDVDSDNVQELIVLEEQGDGLERAVTVWRWHGWGFSLAWRSSGERYRDLVLIPGEGGDPPTISVTVGP